MDKFSKDMDCPKCGSVDLLHRYKKKGEWLDEDLWAFDKAKSELIRTICRCCGHRWSSLPLDGIKEAESDKDCED